MNGLHDLLLSNPLSDTTARILLFITFAAHLLLVLMLIGTSLLGIYYLVRRTQPEGGEFHEDKALFKSFLGLKSLAVVLGVGPLLVIQTNYALAFFNSTSFFAPYWLLIIVILVFSFVLFDSLGHGDPAKNWVRRLSILALAVLLIVPAFFVLILSAAEYPDRWVKIVANDFFPDRHLALHWLLRYLHIMGAAIVFGAVFHYFFQSGSGRYKKRAMLNWALIGLLLQFVLGPLLALSVLKNFDLYSAILLFLGIGAAGLLAWIVVKSIQAGSFLKVIFPMVLLAVTFLSMLAVRDILQGKGFSRVLQKGRMDLAVLEEKLRPYQGERVKKFEARLEQVYDDGGTMYTGACAWCHGEDGSGDGIEMKNLSIPPADLTAIRAETQYIREGILHGVPGTSMPYFAFYDKGKIDNLLLYLDERFHLTESPGSIPVSLSDEVRSEANEKYNSLCAGCHGADGRGKTEAGKAFSPPPPDFTVYSLTPEKMYQAITAGYPGTAMPPFPDLSDEIRWGLVEILLTKRK